jgi:hypothetical protein
MSTLRRRQSPLIPSRTRVYPLALIEEGQLILELLVSLRFATANQVQRVVFDSTSVSPRMAKHRATRSLRRLFDAGFLRRVSVFAPSSAGRMARQTVNVLSAAGARAVGVEPRWVRTRSPRTDEVLVHDFWLMEVAVLAMAGCPEPLSIVAWWDDRILMGRKRRGQLHLPNVPDGYLVIENLATGKRFPCLVELDLGSASVSSRTSQRRDFARKIEGYVEYLHEGFRDDFGIDAPPIVLIIAEGARRMQALQEIRARLGGKGRFWFATLPHLRDTDTMPPKTDSAGRDGPFWAANWQTGLNADWRSLAVRCGL